MFTKWSTENLFRPDARRSVILPVILILLFGLFASACSMLPDEESTESLPEIKPPKISEKPVYKVRTATLETKVRGIGKLMSMQEEGLFFTSEQNLRVKEIYVQRGDTVEAGQLIAELDVTELENQLREQRLNMRTDELRMIEILRKADQMSAIELEQEKINFEKKRTALIELQQQIERAKLVAPFNGTVVSLNLNKGEQVQAYETVALVADLSRLTVAAEIDEDDLEQIAVGMGAEVDINSAGTFQGTVARLPQPDNENQNNGGWPPNNQQKQDSIDQYLIVQLDEFPEGVSRGTPLSVSIVTDRTENAIVIPPSALRTYGGRTYVQVEDEDGNKREVDVEVGQRTPTMIEILEGLESGQKVVGR